MSAIVFDGVGKRYALGQGHRSLSQALGSVFGRATRPDDPSPTAFWALDDVSFAVEPGETVGIIGSNGAGKTTSLKLMSRVTWPSRGRIEVNGRVAALIELGAGFHPELTGRENVFLNAAIMGMSQAETRRAYDRIVAFAELDRFMDTPVKRYSSGMFARLGFAVAAHVAPDILIVDEVLAVGDVNFQRKCFDFIQDFVRSGRTTVFVSHNLYALEQLCSRLIWLDKGRVVQTDGAATVLTAYMDAQDRELRQIERVTETDGMLIIEGVESLLPDGRPAEVFPSGEDVLLRITYRATKPVDRPHFVLAIWDAATRQPLILASMLADGFAPNGISGRGTLTCRFLNPPLMPRTYHVWGEVYAADRKNILVRWQPLASFSIVDTEAADRPGDGNLRHVRTDAPVRSQHVWDGPFQHDSNPTCESVMTGGT
jgi:ABC-type polysaccharide/polyol phosphate transport system ATPase subunit